MPKPYLNPDLVKDFMEFPWWLRVLIVLQIIFVITVGIITNT